MEIVFKRIYSAHTKPRINAKPADLGRSSRWGLSLPFLGKGDRGEDIKKITSVGLGFHTWRGALLIIWATSLRGGGPEGWVFSPEQARRLNYSE